MGLVIVLTTAATGLIVPQQAAAEVVSPFQKRYEESLYGDFQTVGNTVIGCPTTPADLAARCRAASRDEGTDNNNAFIMQRINTAGMDPDHGSSTGRVTVPPGAEIAYARLFWGGNDGTYKGRTLLSKCDLTGPNVIPSPGEPLDAVPRMSVGGSAPTDVSPTNLAKTPTDLGGPHYYTGEADVTSLFAGTTGSATPIPVAVGNIWAPTGQGCVAGWSLTVVYKYDAPNAQYAPDRRNVYLYGGHVIQKKGPDTTVTVDGFYRAGDGQINASVTAYEGDWNVAGDQFWINRTPMADEHTGSTKNFFVSEDDGAVDPKLVNNLSIDAKAFRPPADTIPAGAKSATLRFSSTQDVYVPSQVALSVPVPDLEVTKTVSPKTVRPGGTLTYTVTAKNISRLPYPNAKFTDDLTGNLDDAVYNNDARASTGAVSYSRPRISYQGDIPAGGTATVTYSVKVNDPRTGDGKLRNDVDVETPRSNCAADSTDPACGAAPVIEEPTPPVTVTPVPPARPVPPGGEVPVLVEVTNPGSRPTPPLTIDLPRSPGGPRETWTGVIPAHSTVPVKHSFTAPATPGRYTDPIATDYPNATCAAGRALRGPHHPSDPHRPRGLRALRADCAFTYTVAASSKPTPPGKPTGAGKPSDPGRPGAPHEPMSAGHGKPLGGPGGRLASTGADDDRMWLLGSLALGLTALGVLARAAGRRHRG